MKNTTQHIVARALEAMENYYEYGDYNHPSHAKDGTYPLRANSTEGDNLSLIGDGDVTFRIRMSETLVYIVNIADTMGTISTRVPDDLEGELEEYLEEERLDRSTAVRKLLSEGLQEWRCEQALKRLAADEITLTKGAQLAEMSVWEFAQLAKDHDITWVSDNHLEDDLEDL